MCFSATASFVSAAIIGSIGIATLRNVREARALPFAATPMLFGLHQFIEGLVWLGLDGRIGPAALGHVAFLFMIYAQGILPLLIPAGVALMEPPGRRRTIILGLTAIGALVCAWDVYGLVFLPNRVFVDHHSIAYRNRMTGSLGISLLYLLATCGALLVSTHRVVRWYGALNVVALTIVEIVREYAFASVWCFYAASMSILLYWQFNRRNIDVHAPNGRARPLKPFLNIIP